MRGGKVRLSFPTIDLVMGFNLTPARLNTSAVELSTGDIEDLLHLYGLDGNKSVIVDGKRVSLREVVANTALQVYRDFLDKDWFEETRSLLKECLKQFSNYKYKFYSSVEGKIYSGVAKGIIPETISVGKKITSFQAYYDLVYIIQDCIYGYGLFGVDSSLEGLSKEEFMRRRFFHLCFYWDIYGGKPPRRHRSIRNLANVWDPQIARNISRRLKAMGIIKRQGSKV